MLSFNRMKFLIATMRPNSKTNPTFFFSQFLMIVLSLMIADNSIAMLGNDREFKNKFHVDSKRQESFTYKDYKRIIGFMQELKKENPEIVHLHVAGNSTLGLPIFYASLKMPEGGLIDVNKETSSEAQHPGNQTKASKESGKVDSFLLVGGHHGNEKPSVEAVLSFMRVALENRNRLWLSKVLEKTELHFLPALNPDGYTLANRTQARGLDINRDYYYPGRKRLAFRAKETRVMRKLLDDLKISHAISIHSGLEGVLWPHGYTDKQPNGEVGKQLPEIAKVVGKSMGFKKVMAMYQSYPTFGAFIDYAFTQKNIAALTIEISEDHMPVESELPLVLARSNWGVEAFLNEVHGLGVENDPKAPKQPSDFDPLAH